MRYSQAVWPNGERSLTKGRSSRRPDASARGGGGDRIDLGQDFGKVARSHGARLRPATSQSAGKGRAQSCRWNAARPSALQSGGAWQARSRRLADAAARAAIDADAAGTTLSAHASVRGVVSNVTKHGVFVYLASP